MPADALDPSDALTRDDVHPTEGQRAQRAAVLGAVLGAVLALLARGRSARSKRGS